MFTDIENKLFEDVWVKENVYHRYGESKSLNDDIYISYKIWNDMNSDAMMKKHLPKTLFIRGENPNIIFHGGCLGCISQRQHGIDRCKGCQFFKADWSKPDIIIDGESSASLDQDDINDLFK